MKKLLLSVVALILVTKLCSQEYYQHTEIEMDECFDDNKTYICNATRSIRLLPGFKYSPTINNDMKLQIDRYSMFLPDNDYYGDDPHISELVDNTVVGTLPATFNVDNMGAAVYSVDIRLPQSIGNMVPQLALTYNSQSGNGLMGWTWDVSGLSVITRIGQTEYYDDNVTDVDFVNDRFMVDGKRILALNDAEYGGNGTTYKTEIDNMDKIVSYTDGYKGPKYFVVWKSDGLIWEYGATDDSRLEVPGSDRVVIMWMLNKISDRDGNSILFHYDIDKSTGESYINNIEYTANKDKGVEAAYNVIFEYEMDRYDMWESYVAGVQLSCKRLLKNIIVVKNDTQKKLFNYSFEYYNPDYYGNRRFLYYRLKSIGFTVGERKINSTKIIWNNEKKHYPDNKGYQIFEIDKSVFTEVPFVGDFNGDGLSDVLMVPYKIQNSYQTETRGRVYLNNGNGDFNNEEFASVSLSKNLDWMYVMDLDSDGKDDLITYEYNYDYEYGDDELVKLKVYLMQNEKFVEKASYSYKNRINVIPGNFVSVDNQGIIVFTLDNKKNEVNYISYSKDKVVKKIVGNAEPLNELVLNHMAADITGDGISELLSMERNGCYIHKLVYDDFMDTYNFTYFNHTLALTDDVYTFPNDFNGDGKIDVLYYSPKMSWNILISNGNGFETPLSCSNTNLLRNVVLNTKDRYMCSLKQMTEPTVTIRTADFDGDGISDVALFKNYGGNYYLQIGFMPYKKDDKIYDFSHIQRFYMPINYSHQSIHLGRFLPQENISFISSLSRKPYATEKSYIASIYPHSALYSVERIVDGLGNVRGLSYDYLMPKENSNFYVSKNNTAGYNMRRTSIPIKAVKEDTIFNINGKPIVSSYEYADAIIHTKGHGFLAFEKMTVRTIIDGNCVAKQVQEKECNTMGSNSISLPSSVRFYNGEDQLVKEIIPKYKKYSCSANPKVILPLVVGNIEQEYNYDKDGELLRKTISKYEYQTDNQSEASYDKIVQLTQSVVGYSNDVSANEVVDCSCWNGSIVEFDDDLENWIINRPAIKKHFFKSASEDKVGSVEVYSYNSNNPLKISSITKVPNIDNDSSDSLLQIVDYEYDDFGHVTKKSISSPSLKYKKILSYEYGEKYQYRYLTKTIDELGNEIQCDYDDYGTLIQTIDYNGFITKNEKDPLGIDDILNLSDGMQHVRSLRWAYGKEYAPKNATYYCWEKSTGKSEIMTFYHKTGIELRKVSFDIHGNAVIEDKSYDDRDNLIAESLPYYVNDDKILTCYRYDKYNRLTETTYPNGLSTEILYDGNKVITNIKSQNGMQKTKIDNLNLMGQLETTTDIGGNTVSYEYYSDGLIKSACINGNNDTKVTVKYDNNRNRNYMSDPNYGTINYVNDALGNVTKIVDNKGNVIEYEYDMSGRKLSEWNYDVECGEELITRWIYDNQRGKKGLLKKIYNDNNSIEYFYDDKLRLTSYVERFKDVEYVTSYTYDKANRVSTVSYPTGLTILKTYSNSGYEMMCHDNDDKKLLWKTMKTNACGLITEYQLGNGSETKISYDAYTSTIENIHTAVGEKVIQNIIYEYDDFGNMISRSKRTGPFMKETFEYDKYDRLIEVSLNGSLLTEMFYDDKGNIIRKNENGVDVLYDVIYDDKNPYAMVKAKTDKVSLFEAMNRDVKYSSFNDMVEVLADDKKVDIEYGLEHNRVLMNVSDGSKKISKVYIGNNEFVCQGDNKTKYTYLIGPMGVYGVCTISEDGEKSMVYVHKDNIDSWDVISDENGEVLQVLSFDVWGNRRDSDYWYKEYDDDKMMLDRGYKGHEHLNGFNLINMNGRIYDPVLSVMLSPDNNIQMPQMSQNFNRYSYCLNNPLKYNDPSGEWVESLLLGITFGASNVVFNADKIDTFSEGLLLFGVGFVQGFLAEYTLGQSWFIQVGANTLTGALKSGVNEMVSIGNGSFNFSGDDWNAVAKATYYGLGSSLTKSVFNSYTTPATEDYYGDQLKYLFFQNDEIGHAAISIMSHGMGCWFSGQSMLPTMRFKDVGFDLGLLKVIATKLLRSYIYNSDFDDKAVEQRAQEIKERMLNDILSDDPDHGDFDMITELSYVDISAGRIYVSGNIFAMLPGEVLKVYPKPYLDEVISFPFTYSLFKTLFFNK